MNSSGLYAALIGLVLLGGVSGSAGATWEQREWSSTIFYRATFDPEVGGNAVLHLAAVDRYEVYFNGLLLGADSVWTRMAGYPVVVRDGRNEIGVKVVNRGLGVGGGLLGAVVGDDSLAGERLVETTTNRRVHAWYWTAENQEGTGWTTANVERNSAWQAVQEGQVDKRQIEGLIDTALIAVAGLPGGVDVGRAAGSLTLGQLEGIDLAHGRPTNHVEVVDRDLNTAWEPPINALNFFAAIDLQVRRRIHAVRVFILGRTAADFEANSLHGYSVQVSDDQIRWVEVAVLHDIAQDAWSEVRFAPVRTRHVRLVVVDIDPTTSPRVAEVEILGEGFGEEGIFLSEPLDLGAAGVAKNFGQVRWEAEIPAATAISLRFRTGESPADFADPGTGWSAPVMDRETWFPAPEPENLLQYQVRLATQDERFTPAFNRLEIDYSTAIAVSGARGRVSPNQVPMGVDTTFTYTVALDFREGDLGIERLSIEVPSPAWLDETAAATLPLAGWNSSPHGLTLTFAVPVDGQRELVIPFRTRTLSGVHPFRAYLFSPGSDNPLNVAENQDENPQSGLPYSWSVMATGANRAALGEVKAKPPIFSPNGDGINDYTVIEFTLAKVDVPREVQIRILDLGGGVVRELGPAILGSGVYARREGDDGQGSPGYWDGRNEGGERVPPGIYLYQVKSDLDAGDEVRTGIVAVVY